MKQKYVCRACGREDEFETQEAKRLLLEMRTRKEKRQVYLVKCSHCGAENRVEIAGE